MKGRVVSFFAMVILLVQANCTYNDVWTGEKAPSPPVDYLMFGHNGGFCLNCDEVYKVFGGKLYGASHLTILDPDAVQLNQLPTASYNLVSSLITQIPPRLFTGSTSANNFIGNALPDAGHIYIEVSQGSKVFRWYIEGGNVPNDLQGFVSAVQQALGQLN